jgi:hypothetical protein
LAGVMPSDPATVAIARKAATVFFILWLSWSGA